jgi:hypothetical protein
VGEWPQLRFAYPQVCDCLFPSCGYLAALISCSEQQAAGAHSRTGFASLFKKKMGRLYSFDIRYGDQSYVALASLQQHERDISFRIRFVEGRMGYLRAGDVLVYNEQEGLSAPAPMPAELQRELERCIRSSASPAQHSGDRSLPV